METETEANDEDFEEKVIENSKKLPVVVDFWAEWCLAPTTKIVFNPVVKEIKGVVPNVKILSFNKKFQEEEAEIRSIHTVISKESIKLETECGRKIICTPDHLIMTKKGVKKAEELKIGDFVDVYLFYNDFYEIEKNKKIFLTKEKIKREAKKMNLDKSSYFKELEDKKLFNLTYGEERSYILASLLGLLLSDGCLSVCKNHERLVEFYVGSKEDVEEIKKDLEFLGFSTKIIENKPKKGKIGDRIFRQKCFRVRVSKTSLFLLFKSLGGIEGDKFIRGLKIPQWILSGPKEIQRAFLQGFLGGDGPKVTIKYIHRKNRSPYNRPLINPLELHFSSPKLAYNFSKQISILFKNFDIKVSKIEVKPEERYKRKDGKKSFLLKIWIKNDFKNCFNYASLGFKYCYSKKVSSALARTYLEERLAKVKEREMRRLKTLKMSKKFSIDKISKKLNINYNLVYNWLHGREAFPPQDSIPYDIWVRERCDLSKKIFFDKIKSIKKINKWQEFNSLQLNNDTKIFVANGIIVHNCPPCRILSPIISKVAEEYKEKFLLVKVNIDESPKLAEKYQIMSIPNVKMFKNGKIVDEFIGAMPEPLIKKWLDKNLV